MPNAFFSFLFLNELVDQRILYLQYSVVTGHMLNWLFATFASSGIMTSQSDRLDIFCVQDFCCSLKNENLFILIIEREISRECSKESLLRHKRRCDSSVKRCS